MSKRDIRALSLEEITDFFNINNEKTFRAKQVYEWLWKKSANRFDEMTNLSITTRGLLENNFVINAVTIFRFRITKLIQPATNAGMPTKLSGHKLLKQQILKA